MTIREAAHAKINLTLSVLGRRPDGYHELDSLVTFASLHDVVTLEPGGGDSFTVSGPFASHISGENLLERALALLRDADADLRLGSVHLEKNLPVAAGLGGGSADAAALLRAVRTLNADRAAGIAWMDVAARLGADVPVCLDARPALMRGVGEQLTPVARLPAAHAVLVNPGLPLPTRDVFAALGAAALRHVPEHRATPEVRSLDDLITFIRTRGNDLEGPATRLLPAIRDVKSALLAQPGCLCAAMSGSGPTWFGILADEASASRAAERIAAAHTGWWVKPTLLLGSPAG